MKRINLLPPEHRARASRERGLMYVIVALVALVAVLGLVYYQQHSQVAGKQNQLTGLQAQTASLNNQAAALAPYAQIEQMRSSLSQTTQNINASRVYWSTIFEEISLVIPENVRLTSLSCTVPPNMLPGGTSSSASAAGSTDVTFTGNTYTSDDIASFMTRLGLIPQLTNIQLVNSTMSSSSQSSTTESLSTASPAPASTTVTWQFTVTAQLRSYLTAPPTTTLSQGAAQ